MTARHRAPAVLLALLAGALLTAGVRAGDEAPPLPADEGPPLPAMEGAPEAEPGLPPLPTVEEPARPAPAERPATFDQRLDDWLDALPVRLHGFYELRLGPRVLDDPYQSRSFTLGEHRLQLEARPYWRGMDFTLKSDFVHDLVLAEGRVELREANVAFSPFAFMDVKAGRQVLTWGTGDLVFLNDLFPKDYVSFFTGRDVEYLKAPSDALKMSFFSDVANLDVVYTPQFDPDVFVAGERLSYYNPLVGGRAGDAVRIRTEDRSSWLTDDEVAARLYRRFGSYEGALYGYRGFWKGPVGINTTSGKFTFPRLDAYGASFLGPVGGGIGNAEVSYYNSRDDRSGSNPFVPNSQLRFLLGYKQDLPEVARDLTVGVQYYLEHMMDYGTYERTLPAGMAKADENRHLLTLRLTKLLLNQDLRLDLFTFYSPTDDDVYLRPHVSYAITDRWRLDGGANIFIGDEDHTQFGQFEWDTNAYVGLRYSF